MPVSSHFRTRTAAAALAAFGFAAAIPGAAQAAAEYIPCPLAQVQREITTALPPGWWNTPIISTLTEVQVIPIGGQPALMCIYGASGSIQRDAPEGATCTADAGGFACISAPPPPPAGPVTFSTGGIDVSQTYQFDLDQGQVGNAATSDIWFQAVSPIEMYLTPQNGAALAVGDRSNRGYDGCSAATFTTDRVPLIFLPVGSYVCARTNEGRISQFRLNNVVISLPVVLSLGYTTWQ